MTGLKTSFCNDKRYREYGVEQRDHTHEEIMAVITDNGISANPDDIPVRSLCHGERWRAEPLSAMVVRAGSKTFAMSAACLNHLVPVRRPEVRTILLRTCYCCSAEVVSLEGQIHEMAGTHHRNGQVDVLDPEEKADYVFEGVHWVPETEDFLRSIGHWAENVRTPLSAPLEFYFHITQLANF